MRIIKCLAIVSSLIPTAFAYAHSGSDWGNGEIDWASQSFMPLSPTITYGPADSTASFSVAPSGEAYSQVTPERFALHMQNHDYFPAVNAVIPPFFEAPVLDSADKFVITPEKMVVINPGGEEIIHVMEGKRHGFQNMSISITNTLPGRGAPLHTHVGEEAHIVLKGSVRYFIKGETFVVNGPYIVHIPPMTPHAFQNIGTSIVNIVGVFGSNQWEYDILDFPPFQANTNSNNGSCKFKILNEWAAGANVEVSVTNTTAATVNSWKVNWLFTDGSTRVRNTWNAQLTGKNPYAAQPSSWNAKILPGKTVKFGMSLSKADPSKPVQIPLLEGSLCVNN